MKSKATLFLAIFSFIAPHQASAQVAKPVVGVESVKGGSNQEVPTLRTMIETAIIATNRFTVMDGTQLDALIKGQERCAAGMVVARNGKCQRGNFVDPDFRIAATLTGAGVRTSSNSILLACTTAQAYLSLDIRITEKSTSQIKASDRIDLAGKKNSSCGQGAPLATADVNALARQAADSIANKLVFASFPIEVIALQGVDKVVLSYGQDVLKIGSQYEIFRKGNVATDSQGNSYVIDEKVGQVQVTSAAPRTSIADILCLTPGASITARNIARVATASVKRARPAKGSTAPGACK